jgi:hypothetical protein
MGNVRHCFSVFYASPGANCPQGNKAQQKRQRNGEKDTEKGAKSQAKSNEKAKSIICSICKQPFVSFALSFFYQWWF